MIVQCNLLWLTSPKADLSADKEELSTTRASSRNSPRASHAIAPMPRSGSARCSNGASVSSPGSPICKPRITISTAFRSGLCRTMETSRRSIPTPGGIRWRPCARRFLPSRRSIRCAARPAPAQAVERRRRRAGAFRVGGARASVQWAAFQRLIHLLRARGDDVLSSSVLSTST